MRIAVIIPPANNKNYYIKYLLAALKIKAAGQGYAILTVEEAANDNSANIIITINQERSYAIKSWYWKNICLPAIIKKTRTGCIAWIDEAVNNNFSLKQVLIVSNVDPMPGKTAGYKDLDSIFTYSNAAASIIAEKEGETTTVHSLYLFEEPKVEPLEWEEKELSKLSIADGREYFYAEIDSVENLVGLLKAFTIFKKWQLSSMKLVIRISPQLNIEKLENYKFKDDVVLTDEQAALAAAWAAVYVNQSGSAYGGIYPLLHAHVPVIAPDKISFRDVYEESVYYADVNDPKSLGTAMVELYRNESLRNKLVNESKIFSSGERDKEAINPLWKVLQ